MVKDDGNQSLLAMRDLDVRLALRSYLDNLHEGDADTRVVEEMGIWAHSVRIDVAVINGELHGFELKSAKDTLERLPYQAELYSKVFDRVTLVVADRHAEKALPLIPDWWGVSEARNGDCGVSLRARRETSMNPILCPLHVARLLWKPEAILVMERHGLAKGFKSKPVDTIARRLAEALPIEVLRHSVRSALKGRQTWLGQPVRHQG